MVGWCQNLAQWVEWLSVGMEGGGGLGKNLVHWVEWLSVGVEFGLGGEESSSVGRMVALGGEGRGQNLAQWVEWLSEGGGVWWGRGTI